jgi:hypothetical protein
VQGLANFAAHFLVFETGVEKLRGSAIFPSETRASRCDGCLERNHRARFMLGNTGEAGEPLVFLTYLSQFDD